MSKTLKRLITEEIKQRLNGVTDAVVVNVIGLDSLNTYNLRRELRKKGLSLLVVPVVTMRLVAEERRSGTLEMLITLPVKDSDVIGGKYLGALGLVLVLVLATVVYPIMMFRWPWSLGPLDPGPVVSGYLGLILFSAAAVALGLLVSSFVESQAIAFFVTVVVLGALWFFDDAAEMVGSGPVATILRYVSFQARLSSFWRGLLDTRDIVFFVSVTALSLVVSFRALERRKWA